jgi:hypothetical protein
MVHWLSPSWTVLERWDRGKGGCGKPPGGRRRDSRPGTFAHGFALQRIIEGHGSGGDFATGRFSRGSQYLEFHFRHSLGLVIYGRDDAVLSRADYLRGLGVTGTARASVIVALNVSASLSRTSAGVLPSTTRQALA